MVFNVLQKPMLLKDISDIALVGTGFKKDLMYCELFTCFAVNKLYSVLGVRNVCTKHQIKYFDWLILESEYNNRNRKLYDRK